MTHTITLTENQARLLLIAMNKAELSVEAESNLSDVAKQLVGIAYKK